MMDLAATESAILERPKMPEKGTKLDWDTLTSDEQRVMMSGVSALRKLGL
jgi:hypothetical protein